MTYCIPAKVAHPTIVLSCPDEATSTARLTHDHRHIFTTSAAERQFSEFMSPLYHRRRVKMSVGRGHETKQRLAEEEDAPACSGSPLEGDCFMAPVSGGSRLATAGRSVRHGTTCPPIAP